MVTVRWALLGIGLGAINAVVAKEPESNVGFTNYASQNDSSDRFSSDEILQILRSYCIRQGEGEELESDPDWPKEVCRQYLLGAREKQVSERAGNERHTHGGPIIEVWSSTVYIHIKDISTSTHPPNSLITTSPVLELRQNIDCNSSVSSASSEASRSASESIQQATQSAQQSIQQAQQSASQASREASQSASQAIQQAQQSASQSIQQASQSAAQAVSSASSVVSAISSSMSQVMESASSAVLHANALATAATSRANTAGQVAQEAQNSALTATQAALAIVGSIIASSLVSILMYFYINRYKEMKRRQQRKEEGARYSSEKRLPSPRPPDDRKRSTSDTESPATAARGSQTTWKDDKETQIAPPGSDHPSAQNSAKLSLFPKPSPSIEDMREEASRARASVVKKTVLPWNPTKPRKVPTLNSWIKAAEVSPFPTPTTQRPIAHNQTNPQTQNSDNQNNGNLAVRSRDGKVETGRAASERGNGLPLRRNDSSGLSVPNSQIEKELKKTPSPINLDAYLPYKKAAKEQVAVPQREPSLRRSFAMPLNGDANLNLDRPLTSFPTRGALNANPYNPSANTSEGKANMDVDVRNETDGKDVDTKDKRVSGLGKFTHAANQSQSSIWTDQSVLTSPSVVMPTPVKQTDLSYLRLEEEDMPMAPKAAVPAPVGNVGGGGGVRTTAEWLADRARSLRESAMIMNAAGVAGGGVGRGTFGGNGRGSMGLPRGPKLGVSGGMTPRGRDDGRVVQDGGVGEGGVGGLGNGNGEVDGGIRVSAVGRAL